MGTIDNHQGFKLRFGEFPDLLFTAIDTRTYFDMTHFLQSMNLDPEEKIAEFTAGFALWIEHLAKMYGIPPDEVLPSMPQRNTLWQKSPSHCRSSAVLTRYSARTCWRA